MVRLVVPLLAIPILARTISGHDYGVYMYAIAFAAWVSIFIEYGFSISSTRDIASGKPVHEIVSGTQSAKMILVVLTAPSVLLAVFLFPVFSGYAIWAVAGWFFGVLAAISPIYYFQGKERLKLVGLIETISGVLLLGGVYFLIREESDSDRLPFVLFFSRLLGPIVLTSILTKEVGLRWCDFSVGKGIDFLKKGFEFFIFQAAVSLYTSFNVVFLGFFCGPAQVGVYASAERVMRAGLGFIGQATNAIFPRLNALKTSNPDEMNRVRRLVMVCLFGVGVLGMFVAWLVSTYVAEYFFGGRVAGVDRIINIMALLIPAISLSNVLGFQYLVVDRRERVFNKIIVGCALLNIPLSYFLIKFFMAEGMAYAWVAIEWVITISIAFTVFFRKKLAIA